MSILDKLKQAWDASREKDTGDALRDQAAALAAKQAAAAALAAVEKVGDEFLDDAESMLVDAQKAREGRPDVRPDPSKADDIEGYIKDIAADADSIRARRAQREAAAKEELARLKAQLPPPVTDSD